MLDTEEPCTYHLAVATDTTEQIWTWLSTTGPPRAWTQAPLGLYPRLALILIWPAE